MGSFSLSEITSIRLPFGLSVERDLFFEGRFPLSVYADAARLAGGIAGAEPLLRRIAREREGR